MTGRRGRRTTRTRELRLSRQEDKATWTLTWTDRGNSSARYRLTPRGGGGERGAQLTSVFETVALANGRSLQVVNAGWSRRARTADFLDVGEALYR